MNEYRRQKNSTKVTSGEDFLQSFSHSSYCFLLPAFLCALGLYFPFAFTIDSKVVSYSELKGVIDFHAHADPDSMARSVDVIELAKRASKAGMRGLVLKNHYTATAGYAYLVRKLVPGIEVFGGIALNRSAGGINPAAVEAMAAVKGGYGRVVWMPTFDAENHVLFFKEDRPFVRISEEGQLIPQVLELLKIIAQKDLILATGHSSAEECLLLIQAARHLGVRIIVTHAMLNPINMTIEQQKKAVEAGAFLEHAFVGTLQGPSSSVPSMQAWKGVTLQDYAAAVKAVGAEHCILSSDLGQAGNPTHQEGLSHFISGLRQAGLSDREIELMARRNPARLLGLD